MKLFPVKKLNALIIALIAILILNSNTLKPIVEIQERTTNPNDILQHAATEALGKREGTIIVIDPQTGQILALVNKKLAFDKALASGSTIKPFTALTALRTGLIKEDSTLLCRAPYKHDGFQINCVHEKESAPFDVVHAIANSCNFFFGKLGERLNQQQFISTLLTFGFEEKIGRLPRGKWKSKIALGETEDLLVTPYNLINSYIRLIMSVPPVVARGSLFNHNPAKAFEINPDHRSLLIKGMRGAVEYGTAEKANLDELSLNIFGKTGTASGEGNNRMQGWFVGFAADAETKGRVPNPDEIKLAVLVFIKGAHGSDCAQISKQIFTTFASLEVSSPKSFEVQSLKPKVQSSNDQEEQPADSRQQTADIVLVKIVKENSVREISFEDYVLGVLATESSLENELEALKAQAITTRTYAMKHLQRHAKDGYNFCTLTHCQRFETVNLSSANDNMHRAVEETKGQVLLDSNGETIESYFSASCGGMTANLRDLWGVQSKPYLKTIRDDFCAEMPNSEWIDTIPMEKLSEALRGDKRSNVGKRLNQIRIVKRDSSGRAEMLLISGERQKQLHGWDFKIIVGRALGWNLIKSSRFSVRRVGDNFVFTGSGFGHGLGLCQAGAHVMAQRGFNFQQILSRYFPTTRIDKL